MSTPKSTTSLRPGAIVVIGLIALVCGWAMRLIWEALGVAEPLMPWWAVAVIWILAFGVAVRAWLTWRVLQRGKGGMAGFQAVNRLVLGQAAALAGVAILGVYVGSLISRIAVPVTELTDDRVWLAVASALGGLVMMVAGLWLERACRLKDGDTTPEES